MGFFSFTTADTQESIANDYAEHENSGRLVFLLQPNGQEPIVSHGYNGYGVFGGVDAFAWLTKQNAEHFSEDVQKKISKLDLYENADSLRDLGIDLFFDEEIKLQFPLKLSFNEQAVYEDIGSSENCRYQGFFYP